MTRSTQATDPAKDRLTESLPTKGSFSLVSDPFINETSPAVNSVRSSVVTTAMPWLNNDEQSDDGDDQTRSIVIKAVIETEPETTSVISTLNDEHSDDGHDQTHSIDISAVAEPESGGELVQKTATEAVTQATEPNGDPEISETIQKRLTEGRIVVKLPAGASPPSENNSDSSKATSRWSWLGKALRRS